MKKGNSTQATGGKQRGAKIVTGSTSTVRLGANHRAVQTKGGMKKPGTHTPC